MGYWLQIHYRVIVGRNSKLKKRTKQSKAMIKELNASYVPCAGNPVNCDQALPASSLFEKKKRLIRSRKLETLRNFNFSYQIRDNLQQVPSVQTYLAASYTRHR